MSLNKKSYLEKNASQNPAIELLCAMTPERIPDGGYLYISPEDCMVQRGSSYNVILKDVLRSQLRKLNRFNYAGAEYEFSSANIERAIDDIDVPLTDGLSTASEKIYDKLLLGESYPEVIGEGDKVQSFNLRYIDWENPQNNVLHVTSEFNVESADKQHNARSDIVLFINGIQEPLLIDDPNIFFSRVLHHQLYLYAWNKLIKRQLLIDNNIFFVEGIIYEDQCWSYQLFSQISSVLLLPRLTYVYEHNQNSIVNTTFTSGNANKAVWSYTVSTNMMLDNPPSPGKYRTNMTPQYLLFMLHFVMNGVDVLSRFPISVDIAKDFRVTRFALLTCSLRYGRLLISCFCLLMFWPFSLAQKLKAFRHHYYDIESVINRLSHLTDFMHNKNRI